MVCTFGISSGGHQAMPLGMHPRDARYSAISLPGVRSAVDASVRGVIMGAPVIDPIGRYRYARQLKESGKPYPEFVDMVLPQHDNTGSPKKRWSRAVRCRRWSAAKGSRYLSYYTYARDRTSPAPARALRSFTCIRAEPGTLSFGGSVLKLMTLN
jgi:hypothetical protein